MAKVKKKPPFASPKRETSNMNKSKKPAPKMGAKPAKGCQCGGH